MNSPKTIKKYKKRKFTEKRNNYKNYNDAKWNWNDIFIEIYETKSNIKSIAIKYNIVYKTLADKYKKLLFNDQNKVINIENRGGSNKLFTDDE